MTMRLAAWIAGALAVAVVLSMLASYVGSVALLLAVPVAVAGSILTRRPPKGHAAPDVAERLVAAAATLTGRRTSPDGEQADWGAALRAELASITVPRERRRFALGAAVALFGRPHRRRSLLLAAGVAVAFGTALLGVSRAALGDDGLGSVTILLPPLMLFWVGYLCAHSRRSLRFGLETGILAAVTTLVAVAVVYGIEAAHWYHLAPRSASSTASTSPSTRPGQPSWTRCTRSSSSSTSCSGRPGRCWARSPGREHRGPPPADAAARAVLLACFPLSWWDHVLTLPGTGLRFGELAGLRRRRLQLDRPTAVLHVVDTRYQAGRFGSGFKPRPKATPASAQFPRDPWWWRRSAASSPQVTTPRIWSSPALVAVPAAAAGRAPPGRPHGAVASTDSPARAAGPARGWAAAD